MNLWSSFEVNKSEKEAKCPLTMTRGKIESFAWELSEKGQDEVESNNGEIFFEELLQARGENVNEYLSLGVIGFERYVSDDKLVLLLHISMPDYCHES